MSDEINAALIQKIKELETRLGRLERIEYPSGVVPTVHTHSKLVASDGSPDPAWSTDADGDLAGAANLDLTVAGYIRPSTNGIYFATTGQIQTAAGAFTWNAANGDLIFQINGVERMRLDSASVCALAGLLNTVGGVHIGGTSDPGADNLLVDGTAEHTGATTLTGLTKTVAGLHVGGTSDPGADNLLVDGTATITGATTLTGLTTTVAGMHIGGTSDPGTDNLLVDGYLGVNVAPGTYRINATDNAGVSAIQGNNAHASGVGVGGAGGYYGVYGSGDRGVYGTGTTYGVQAYNVTGGDPIGMHSTGAIYTTRWCGAASFWDYSKFDEHQDALADLMLVKGDGKGHIDHNTLPAFARTMHKIGRLSDENDPKSDVIETEDGGRDLGAMVSMLTVAIQQLNGRIEKLEKI